MIVYVSAGLHFLLQSLYIYSLHIFLKTLYKILFSEEFLDRTVVDPVLVTPSVFIINNDGIPLDMLYGNFTSQELTRKINKAIEVGINKNNNIII